MKTTFKSVIELLDYYKDETTCRALLEQQRWNGKVTCPHCGSEKVYRTNRGFKCGNSDCYKKFSVTVGTIFENTKIALRYWYGAIYLATAHKKGISSHQLSRDLGISQKTAWFILHRVRHMLKDKAPHVLGTNPVEIDETYIGGKEKNKHKRNRTPFIAVGRSKQTKKKPVLALVERGGKVVVRPIDEVDKETLYPVMLDHVKQGSVVYTDAYSVYTSLNRWYTHEYVNNNYGQYVYGDVHTNTVEGFFSLLKRGIIGIYHQVSVKHLAKYCTEFSYRYNSRTLTDVERFQHVLTHAEGRLTWNQLIAKPNEAKQTEGQ